MKLYIIIRKKNNIGKNLKKTTDEIIVKKDTQKLKVIFPDGSSFTWKRTEEFSQAVSILQVPNENIMLDALRYNVVDLPLVKGKLRSRIINSFKGVGIKTVAQLIDKKDELFLYRNFGVPMIIATQQALAKLGCRVSIKISETKWLV